MAASFDGDHPTPGPAEGRSLALALLASTRPKQWTKNGLLFMGLIFSRGLVHPDLVLRVVVAFLAFCALASATYILNDLVDLEGDRQHPTKRKRPIASGRVPPSLAVGLAVALLAASLLMSWSLGPSFALSALLYLTLSFSYSLWLKHVVIVDVLAVAAGFVLRAAAGAVAIDVPVSPWLYVCTVLGALFLVFCKRRHELVLLEGGAASHRRTLAEYSVPLLDQMISVVTSATLIAYSLYTFSAEHVPKNHAMMLTIPFLMYGIFRYLYLIHNREAGGTPEDVLLSDRPLQATIVGWGLASVAILYLAA